MDITREIHKEKEQENENTGGDAPCRHRGEQSNYNKKVFQIY
jgi:hypothetical protein